MLLNSSFTIGATTAYEPPHAHRPNPRRQRPGSRKRRALAAKQALAVTMNEGLQLARDASVHLPHGGGGAPSTSPPSAILHPSALQNWLRWQEAELRAVTGSGGGGGGRLAQSPLALHEASDVDCQLFGGELGDDAWRRLTDGLSPRDDCADAASLSTLKELFEDEQILSDGLYEDDDEDSVDSEDEQPEQEFFLPLHLSLARLSTDGDISKFMLADSHADSSFVLSPLHPELSFMSDLKTGLFPSVASIADDELDADDDEPSLVSQDSTLSASSLPTDVDPATHSADVSISALDTAVSRASTPLPFPTSDATPTAPSPADLSSPTRPPLVARDSWVLLSDDL